MEELRNIQLSTYPIFSLKGLITEAKLLSNYDGDTADIILFYKGIPMHLKARFYGYDCSEMKPSIKDPNRDEKKKKAIEAKKRLWYLCTNQEEEAKGISSKSNINTQSHYKGSTTIYQVAEDFDLNSNINKIKSDEELFKLSINNQMISEGHAYAYFGGTKEDF